MARPASAERQAHHAAAGCHPPRGVGLRQVRKPPTTATTSPVSTLGRPGGGAGVGQEKGRQTDPFVALSGPEEEGRRSPEVRQRPRQVSDPCSDRKPTQGICECDRPPSAASGGGFSGGSLGEGYLEHLGCPGEESGLGAVEAAMAPGRGHGAHPTEEATAPLPLTRGYLWRLKGLQGAGQPSEPPIPSSWPPTPSDPPGDRN